MKCKTPTLGCAMTAINDSISATTLAMTDISTWTRRNMNAQDAGVNIGQHMDLEKTLTQIQRPAQDRRLLESIVVDALSKIAVVRPALAREGGGRYPFKLG